jgi:hypothetical protein
MQVKFATELTRCHPIDKADRVPANFHRLISESPFLVGFLFFTASFSGDSSDRKAGDDLRLDPEIHGSRPSGTGEFH